MYCTWSFKVTLYKGQDRFRGLRLFVSKTYSLNLCLMDLYVLSSCKQLHAYSCMYMYNVFVFIYLFIMLSFSFKRAMKIESI